ncbi:MAG: hypothetical protein FGM32_10610 [Candidatus Kapabacteria bacterium]|nr:hypothetical protein [Candidatus Kapabacteria bacterium]
MTPCIFDSTLIWTVIDTLAAFCIMVNPNSPDQVWYASQGGFISVYHFEERRVVRRIVVDTSNPQGRITNIVFDPLNPSIVFASGILMQGIYRSDDGGASWAVIRRHDYFLTNYVGECLKVVRRGNGVRIVSANFSRGELEYSDDRGVIWNSSLTGMTGSICSINLSPDESDTVLLGCKYGKLLRSDLQSRTSELTAVITPDAYCEIPRIITSTSDQSVRFGISAGFDSTNRTPGLFQSCDRGRTWTRHWLQGVNIWAVATCQCSRHVAVGGFSEFSNIIGRGIVAKVNVSNDEVVFIGSNIPWHSSPSSVWDMKLYEQSETGKSQLFIATEDGVYLGQATNQ